MVLRPVCLVLLTLSLPARADSGVKGWNRGSKVWVKEQGKLHQISRLQFLRRYKLTWTDRQLFGKTVREAPGYSDGFQSIDWKTGELIEQVDKRYRPGAAEKRALAGKTAALYVGLVNAQVGNGLYARKTIKPGDVIGEYTGVARAANDKKDHTNGYTYVYDPWNSFHMVVDARQRGNYIRFANHSDKNANSKSKMVYDEASRRWHVLLVATRTIKPDQQVLFSYGSGYGWERFGMTKPAELTP